MRQVTEAKTTAFTPEGGYDKSLLDEDSFYIGMFEVTSGQVFIGGRLIIVNNKKLSEATAYLKQCGAIINP